MTTNRYFSHTILLLLALALSLTTAVVPAGVEAAEGGPVKCVNGKAGEFPCEDIDLMAHVQPTGLNGGGISDVWGWVDPETKKEYAVVGGGGGVRFFDVSKPTTPVEVGRLVGQ